VEAVRDGVFHQEELSGSDLDRVVELMRRFQDFPLGVADASIIAVAERLKIREIASIDGHFRAVRPHGIDFSTMVVPSSAGTDCHGERLVLGDERGNVYRAVADR
jgi:uncharacterized protein